MRRYSDVKTRFLRNDERLILSNEKEMPLVIEPENNQAVSSLQNFLNKHSEEILEDISQYGAILLRGFNIQTEEDFEKTILSIQGLRGMSDALMSEEGRIHTGQSKYILHTNAVYKTGGTLYLGGFHSENYYSPDVPGYICFACFKPSTLGGETGLINMKKIYQHLSDELKNKLEKEPFFVAKWLVDEVAKRYNTSSEAIEKMCTENHLPLVGEGKNKFMYMYKPNIFKDAITGEKSLQINLFEIHRLNAQLRQCFMSDYQSKEWFWHRFVWKLPKFIFKSIKRVYVIFASFFYSPKDALQNLKTKIRTYFADKHTKRPSHIHERRVGQCFQPEDVKQLAKAIRNDYCSFLWQKGDVLIVDNKQVLHAGMPGAGPRLIRAMICNPLEMNYEPTLSGQFTCNERAKSIGDYLQQKIEVSALYQPTHEPI